VDIAGCAMPMQQIYERLNITPKELADFCEKWQIAELAVFGSILRNEFRPNGENPSDVDILFSYLPGTNMSLFRRAVMKVEFEDRIGGKLQWLHVVSTTLDSWYRSAAKRKELESLSGIWGVVVHDHWKPYFQIPGVTHNLCNAHHLQELYALSTIEQESWATAMSRLLHLLCRAKHRYPEGVPEDIQQRISQLYRAIVSRAIAGHEAQDPLPRKSQRRQPKQRVGHNLATRLQTFAADVL
jgi:predicted nucleotidyltransferase